MNSITLQLPEPEISRYHHLAKLTDQASSQSALATKWAPHLQTFNRVIPLIIVSKHILYSQAFSSLSLFILALSFVLVVTVNYTLTRLVKRLQAKATITQDCQDAYVLRLKKLYPQV